MDIKRYTLATAAVLADLPATRRSWGGLKDERLPGGVPVLAVARPVVGPQCVTVGFKLDDRDVHLVLNGKTETRLAVKAGVEHVRAYRDKNVIFVEFDLPFDEWREVEFSKLNHSSLRVAVGERSVGGTAYVTWGESPNKAVFGLPGSGKTVCLIDMVMSVAKTDPGVIKNEFVILNPKEDHLFEPLRRLPNLAIPMADGYEQSALALRWAVAEMERRKGNMERMGKRLIIFADEVAQLIQVQPEATDAIRSLAQFARGMNMNLIIASQVANPTVFGDEGTKTKDLFGSRLVFQLPNDQAWMATNVKGQHTAWLGGKGDGLAVNRNKVTRFRAALPGISDYESLPRAEAEPEPPPDDQLAGDRALEPDEVLRADEVEISHVFDTGTKVRCHFDLPELSEKLAYALVKRSLVNGRMQPVGADGIRAQFGGAMVAARLLRDLAAAVRRDAAKLRG